MQEWEKHLEEFTDQNTAEYIINGLTNGFKIGQTNTKPTGTNYNIPLENKHKLAILDWIKVGTKKGFLLGPYNKNQIPFKKYVTSPIFSVQQSNKIRPILNLSAPKISKTKISVNKTIDDKAKDVTYIKLHEIVKLFYQAGRSATMWIADLQDAYLVIPIDENDKPLLGFQFGNKFFFMNSLMFGLSSAPAIYNRFSETLKNIINNKFPQLFSTTNIPQLLQHYLDDFFSIHPLADTATKQQLEFLNTCSLLAVPVKRSKLQKGTDVKLLGWRFNSDKQILYIDEEKQRKTIDLINEFISKHKQRQSIIFLKYQQLYGLLRWISTAIIGSSSLLTSLHYNMFSRPNRHAGTKIRISTLLVNDLKLFKQLISSYRNGIKYTQILNLDKPQLDIYVDGSADGLGGWTSNGRYYSFTLPIAISQAIRNKELDIYYFETLALTAFVHQIQKDIANIKIRIFTDNTGTEGTIRKWKCLPTRPDILNLIKTLSYTMIKQNSSIQIERITTTDNVGADTLSRPSRDTPTKHIQEFKKWFHNARPNTTLVEIDCSQFINEQLRFIQNDNLNLALALHCSKYAKELPIFN